jgi:hypothetical protein
VRTIIRSAAIAFAVVGAFVATVALLGTVPNTPLDPETIALIAATEDGVIRALLIAGIAVAAVIGAITLLRIFVDPTPKAQRLRA